MVGVEEFFYNRENILGMNRDLSLFRLCVSVVIVESVRFW